MPSIAPANESSTAVSETTPEPAKPLTREDVNRLLEEYRRDIVITAKKIAKDWGPAAKRFGLDELEAEGFLAAWKAIEGYDASKGASLRSWVQTSVRGKLRNALRNFLKEEEGQPQSIEALTTETHDPLAYASLAKFTAEERSAKIRDAIDGLPPRDKKLAAWLDEGRTLPWMAKKSKVSLLLLNKRVAALRSRLKYLLSQELDG